MSTLFDRSRFDREGYGVEPFTAEPRDLATLIGSEFLGDRPPTLPETSEGEVIRHFTNLSRKNYAIDVGFYPLGSCTMKYNPRVNETAARLPGFAGLHPDTPDDYAQGGLALLWHLERLLCEILGMDRVTLQPLAGAHGELTGLLTIQASHRKRNECRHKVVVPDSSHGTNPATANMAGMEIVQIKSNDRGTVDLDALRAAMADDVAAFMLTNPNTLGLFDENIQAIAEIVHKAGALLYYDGANLNATLGWARPGDCGFDVVHTNLHKTFATPHGGGGPGAGPVGVKKELVPFLPKPLVGEKNGKFFLDHDRPDSIGRMAAYHGNFGVLVRAYAYIRAHGAAGLKSVSEDAVLHANYLMHRLKGLLDLPYDRLCKHEFVLSADNLVKAHGIRALDVAKRLLDLGYHAPTIYFPLCVHEAIMIEPTETETLETLDAFVATMEKIVAEAHASPEILKNAPTTTPVRRLDETRAARDPKIRWAPPAK